MSWMLKIRILATQYFYARHQSWRSSMRNVVHDLFALISWRSSLVHNIFVLITLRLSLILAGALQRTTLYMIILRSSSSVLYLSWLFLPALALTICPKTHHQSQPLLLHSQSQNSKKGGNGTLDLLDATKSIAGSIV